MNRISIFILLILFMVNLGCTQNNPNTEDTIKKEKELATKELSREVTKKTDKNKPKVSRTTSQVSKPAIEISKETSIVKNKELYIVPNQFPFQNTDQSPSKKDCKDEKNCKK